MLCGIMQMPKFIIFAFKNTGPFRLKHLTFTMVATQTELTYFMDYFSVAIYENQR